MDTLTGLLDGPKARGAFLLRSVLSAPWSLRIEDRAPLSVITVLQGAAWIRPDGGDPVLVRPGDLALLRGPDAYRLTDGGTDGLPAGPAGPAGVPTAGAVLAPPAPGEAAEIVIGPGQVCSRDGVSVATEMALGLRTWGETRPGDEQPSVLLTGTYQEEHEIGRRLLAHLPTLLVRPAGVNTTEDTLVRLLAAEVTRAEPGQEVMLDRLLDLLVVGALRGWLSSPDGGAPAWLRAEHDEVVGPALRLLHDDPARAWTVAGLAAEVGVSRAGLARRFTSLVGEPPMAYLANRRLATAADLLRDPGHTIAWVARRVGYSDAFALSTAFKRVRGLTPQEHRRLAGAVAPAGGSDSAPPQPAVTTVVLAG
ncbi:AraC family transcriptional regulator [Streptomyces sp. BE20]|uniref:AraC family transcriptional regulator n=1 Tax=Streptomycetaceae TaxID=2062 RepID=UPI002E79C043|nr:AraC family transcriptional regulator [Streptomyces sp. BE20]MEE1824881.1 AraC family transcriptional regulator [Streptomyces sp. BE20]